MSPPPTPPAGFDTGAAGLDQSGLRGHVPPRQAGGDRVHRTKRSLVTRVLPDGPRHPDGSLAFTSGVCVYLPPGFVASGLRYPTIHLLHGGGGAAADAATFGHIRALVTALRARRRRAARSYRETDGSHQWYRWPQ